VSNKNLPVHSTENSALITLTVGDAVIPAILYDNPTARDLLSKLPHKVRLSRFSGGNYCGGIRMNLFFNAPDAQKGYWNGELAYWILGDGFVIFFKNEENSLGLGEEPDLIMLGKITNASDIKMIEGLECSIEVTIDGKNCQ